MSTMEYPNIEPGAVDFKGYHGPEQLPREEKAKLAREKLASGAKPPMGPAPETTAQARGGKVKGGTPSR